MSENLILRTDGPVAVMQLHRPTRKNTLSRALRGEIAAAVADIAGNRSLRAVVVTGGDEVFCAGADISEIQGGASSDAIYRQAREFQELFDRIENLPQPVIAAVSGFALGGGFELALACDFRIASETARFALSEVKIGAMPGGGGTQRLPRLIGVARAKEMVLTGDPISAEDAKTCGLVMTVVAREKLLDEALAFAARLAALPRLALEASKKVINRGVEIDLAAALELEARAIASLGTSSDWREGTLAFMEKRKPVFTGE